MRNLTPNQIRVVELIRDFTEDRGYSPTLDEIAKRLRVSKPTVQQYLRALEEKGVIHRERYAHRSIEIIGDGDDDGIERNTAGRDQTDYRRAVSLESAIGFQGLTQGTVDYGKKAAGRWLNLQIVKPRYLPQGAYRLVGVLIGLDKSGISVNQRSDHIGPGCCLFHQGE